MNYQLTQNIHDLEEHLRILKENLQIVSVELGSLLSERDTVSKELDFVKQEIVDTRLLISENLKKNNQAIENSNKITELNYLESKEVLSEANIKAREITDKAKQEKEELISINSNLRKERIDLKKEVDYLTDVNPGLLSQYKQLRSDIVSSTKELNDITGKVLNLSKQKEELEYKLGQERISFEKELSEISKLIQKEKDKISKPLESLEVIEFELAKREKNLEILKLRFKTKYEKIFPGQQIII